MPRPARLSKDMLRQPIREFPASKQVPLAIRMRYPRLAEPVPAMRVDRAGQLAGALGIHLSPAPSRRVW